MYGKPHVKLVIQGDKSLSAWLSLCGGVVMMMLIFVIADIAVGLAVGRIMRHVLKG